MSPDGAGHGDLEEWRRAGLVGCTPARHGPLLFFCNDSGALTLSLRHYGEWAENELSFLRRFIAPGAAVIDVGAYIGTHALAFADMVGDRGSVFAIEAQPASFRLLRENLRRNGAAQVAAIHAAAGPGAGTVALREIDIAAEASFGSAAIGALAEAVSGPAGAAVRVIALDELGLTACALVKIDAEGSEPLVLDGARRLVRTLRPIVYAECNSIENGRKVLQRFEDHGYRALLHVADAYNPDNWNANRENIFGSAKEAALVGVPPERFAAVDAMPVRRCEQLFEIRTLDDLVAGMLMKPQYPHEVLAGTSIAAASDAAHRLALVEVQQAAAAAREEAEQARAEAETARQLAEAARVLAEAALQRSETAQQQSKTARAEADAAKAAALAAREALSQASEAAARQQAELDRSRARLAAIEASTSWRLTAPARAIFNRLPHRRRGKGKQQPSS